MPLQIGSPFTGLFRMLLCIMHAGEEQSEPFAGGGSSNSAAASAAPDNTAVIAAITQMDQIRILRPLWCWSGPICPTPRLRSLPSRRGQAL